MSRVIVLGGCGGIGSVAARALAGGNYFDEIVLADLRAPQAEALAASLARPGGPKVTGLAVDATSHASLVAAIKGCDVALNCIGPFYRFGPPVLDAAIEAGVNYVDVCDDLKPTVTMLERDGAAAAKGVSALIGMGNSPGLANVFVALCGEMFLDQITGVDIMHIHGGEPEEGAAVLKHRIHAMTNDVPLFIDGAFVQVRQLEASGQAHVRETEFRHVGKYPVYPYPHPETITLPKFIPGLKRATNLGVIFPLSYFGLTQDMVRVGACGETPLTVNGAQVNPLDFSVAHILSRRAELLKAAGVTGPAGCLKVVVDGVKDGQTATLVFQISSESAGAGEGTGIPAAAGAVLMGRGSVTRKGVFPPEGGIPAMELLLTALEMAKSTGAAGRDSFSIEYIDAQGNVKAVPLPV
jgi:saccharopine dehydrogenase-like NADP-dependent oxidoreductase